MANKLKKLVMSSVDFVRRGANQDADIMLFKSMDGGPGENAQIVMKSADQIDAMIQKSEKTMSYYAEVLCKSIASVLNDDSMTDTEAQKFMEKSLSEFDEAVKNDIISEFTYTANSKKPKSKKESEDVTMKSANEIMAAIDKSALSGDELNQLGELLTKACGSTKTKKADGIDDMEDDPDDTPFPPKKNNNGEGDGIMTKSAGVIPPAIQAALDRMEGIAKNIEMNEYREIAKKYTILGEDQEKLAKSLYEMKQTGEEAYNSYVSALDRSVNILEKSGIFGEIGKSAHGGSYYGSMNDTQAKIQTIAKGIMEKDPSMSETMAIAKAWEDHPELAVDYENSRR